MQLISLQLILFTLSVAYALNFNTRLSMSTTITTTKPSKVLIVGGTRFSGLYLWRELYKRVWELIFNYKSFFLPFQNIFLLFIKIFDNFIILIYSITLLFKYIG